MNLWSLRVLALSLFVGVAAVGCGTETEPGGDPDAGGSDTGGGDTAVMGCGDGTVERGEGCDDGNIDDGDGCASDCTVEAGWSCTGRPSVCTNSDLCAGVDCSGLNTECSSGSCDPATGACVAAYEEDGTACDGGNLCITSYCQGGTCVGGDPVDCSALNNGCSRGRCDSATGECVSELLPEGATDCSALDSDCSTGFCNRESGECESEAINEDGACEDDDLCTADTVCTDGVCGGGDAVDCSELDTECGSGVCDPETGTCAAEMIEGTNGFECGGDGLCLAPGTCDAGLCVGEGPVDCREFIDGCSSATCNPDSGECDVTVFDDGAACTGLGSCVTGGTCEGGTCEGGDEVDCTDLDSDCSAGWCDPDTGDCNSEPINHCGSCNDGAGVCAGGECLLVVVPQSEGFEAPLPTDSWSTGGVQPWTLREEAPNSGSFAAYSGDAGDFGSSSLYHTVELAARSRVSFYVKTSTPTTEGYLYFLVDGTELSSWDGATEWREVAFTVDPGSHIFEWRFESDLFFELDAGEVAIDDLHIASVCADDDACTADVGELGACTQCPIPDGEICDGSNACAPSFCDEGECIPEPLEDGASCDVSEFDCVTGVCDDGACDLTNIEDCTVCGEAGDGLCASGVCARPATERFFDFENARPPTGWVGSGDADWFVTATNPQMGGYAFESGDITHSESTSASYTTVFEDEMSVSFYFRTSTESTYDFLQFIVDGILRQEWSGENDWTLAEFTVPRGERVLEWRYIKDSTSDSGSDSVAIDEIAIVPTCDDGDRCTFDLNGGDGCVECPAVEGALCDESADCAPGYCRSGRCTSEPIDDGESCDSDPHDCIVAECADGDCVEIPLDDCTPCGPSGTGVCAGGVCGGVSPETREEFDSGVLPADFTTGGDSGWTFSNSDGRSGSGAAKSGSIANVEESWLTTEITVGEGTTLSFYARTSTDASDVLAFELDDVEQATWSGETEWTLHTQVLDAGTYSLRWSYTKDGFGIAGSDTVWIEDFVVSEDPGCTDSGLCEAGLFTGTDCVTCALPDGATCTDGSGACVDDVCEGP